MRKLRNAFRILLFIIGVGLQFSSFYVSQVEQAPWVLNIVNPRYVRGTMGVRKLEGEKPLDPNDEGFLEVSNVIKTMLKERYPNEDWYKLDIKEYVPEGKTTVTGLGLNLGGIKVRCFFSNGREGTLRTDNLKGEFEKMRKKSIFRWSLGLLIVGIVVVQIPLFLIESAPAIASK